MLSAVDGARFLGGFCSEPAPRTLLHCVLDVGSSLRQPCGTYAVPSRPLLKNRGAVDVLKQKCA
eukprot:445432-Alexandrium_andersonii.AAC.1